MPPAGASSAAMAAPTASRTVAGEAPLRVYLGYASGVQLEINEHAVAIGRPFVHGDVARFEAGADGVSCAAIRTARNRAADGARLSKIIEPLARRARYVAGPGGRLAVPRIDDAGGVRVLRLRGISRAGDRADAAVQALDRRFYRHRREGDVQLRRSGRGPHHAAPRGDRGDRARDDLQRPAAREPIARLVHGSDVSARAPAGGALSPVSPDRRRGVRLRQGPDVDAEIILLAARLLRRLGLGA
jgi:hypothetical protein